jgi:twitching motility protein PilU
MEQNNQLGMHTFDQSLLDLFVRGIISEETALSHADQAGDLKIKIREAKLGGSAAGDGGLSGMDTSRLKFSE